MKRFISIVVLSFLVCVMTPLAHAARAVPMPKYRNVVIVNTPKENAAKETHDAIIAGVKQSEWVVLSDDGNTLRLSVDVRGKHSVVIDVHIHENEVDIDHVSSQNMLYESDSDGNEVIHRNYRAWIRRLLGAFRAAAKSANLPDSVDPADPAADSTDSLN